MSSYINKVSSSMENKQNIRNVSVVSHVDHGKTTLSDHLLQAGGLISKSMAGSARALDYLEEEQKRGITIKTANISFIFDQENESYLINLVDTPGHVDFSGMVSQALRLVDGVIIVVDAVEQIMAQTESVIKQSMKECLKPILFINKVDRLINELKLPKEKIETRINNIIQMVNELIEQYNISSSSKDWKVRFDKGTVIMGSALNGWAISSYSKVIPQFDQIIKHHEEDNIEQLRSDYSIVDAFLTSIIENVPSPLEAQPKRIQHITQFIDESSQQAIQECKNEGPLISCLGKLLYEDNRGIISVIRIFSGSVKSGSRIRNRRTGDTIRVQQVCIYKGQSLVTIDSVGAGSIAVIIGLKDVQIGDTLVSDQENSPNILFDQISYLQESVISQRIEPRKVSDIPKLQKNLDILSLIKPNFHYSTDENTGEMKIHGIGELQLEIIIGEIEKTGITVEVSDPEVTLIEQIEEEVRLQKKDQLNILEIEITCKSSQDETKDCIYSDYRDNCLKVETKIPTEEIRDIFIIGFQNAIRRGPLRNYPIRKLTAVIHDIQELTPDSLRYEIIVPLIRNAIHESLLNGKVGIFEPIYHFTINTPIHFLGPILIVLQRFNSNIEDTTSIGSKSSITGEISVESSLQIASELRSASDGYAFWQFDFIGYKRKREL